MYNTILNLFVNGVGAVQGTLIYSTLEVISTCCCAFVVLLPFIIIWKVIQLLLG